jgi:rod shape-determining protein MreD
MPYIAANICQPLPRFRWAILCTLGAACGLLHATLWRRIPFGEWQPDLFSLLALYYALYANRQSRYLPCLILGLIRDFLSLGLLGSYAVLYSLLHKAASRARVRLDPDNFLNAVLMAAAGTFLVNFGYHMMLAIAGDGIGWARALARCAMIACATAPLAPFAFVLGNFVLARLGVQRVAGGFVNV